MRQTTKRLEHYRLCSAKLQRGGEKDGDRRGWQPLSGRPEHCCQHCSRKNGAEERVGSVYSTRLYWSFHHIFIAAACRGHFSSREHGAPNHPLQYPAAPAHSRGTNLTDFPPFPVYSVLFLCRFFVAFRWYCCVNEKGSIFQRPHIVVFMNIPLLQHSTAKEKKNNEKTKNKTEKKKGNLFFEGWRRPHCPSEPPGNARPHSVREENE